MRSLRNMIALLFAMVLCWHTVPVLRSQPPRDERPELAPIEADARQPGPGPRQSRSGSDGLEGPRFGRRGFGGPGFGGPGFRQEQKLVAEFDQDKNGWLNATERAAARQAVRAERSQHESRRPRFGQAGPGEPGPPGMGPPHFGRPRNLDPPASGDRVSPADVEQYPHADLYDPAVLRTLFLDFENDDWESELSDFHNTDVEVPATLTVDGKQYPNVGVHFRGQSSYMMVPAGYKRSLNVSLDYIDGEQRLYGYRTLNLLNAHEDDSFMSSVLYSQVARQYVPTPKANFVRVVINGEDWGVYPNLQQFNKDFVNENFGTDQGRRWKVSGNPGADGGLRYLGEEIEPYRQRFTIKSKDEEPAWRDLIKLCRTLDETPPDQLEAALEPILDLDGALKFLALDVALVNNDGYWVRASDYSLYQDSTGKFHLIPSDMNEAFRGRGGPRGGPGMRGRRGFRGRDLRSDRERPAAEPGSSRPEEPEQRRSDRRRPAGLPPFGPPGPPDFDPPGFGPPGSEPQGLGPPGPGRRFGPPPFGPGGGGVELDPLVGIDSERTPLRSKLLAVPALKARYLRYVRQIADESLDWNTLGPVVAGYRALIRDLVQRDTRKLASYEDFIRATADEPATRTTNERDISLRTFADKRRAFLLGQTESVADVESADRGQ